MLAHAADRQHGPVDPAMRPHPNRPDRTAVRVVVQREMHVVVEGTRYRRV
jgi:hypothetical protein